MFAVIKKQSDASANKIKEIIGFNFTKTKLEIDADLQTISNQMRNNISKSLPIETDLLKTGLSLDDVIYYAAIFAEIFTHELLFCLHTIYFIKFITIKYHEEHKNTDDNITTLLMTKQDFTAVSTKLSDDLLVESGLLYKRFFEFIQNFGDSISIPTISTNYLQYGCTLSLFNRFSSSIVSTYSLTSYPTYGQLAGDFRELNDISQNAWLIIKILSSSNLFRLIKGTSYEKNTINPDDAIFSTG